MTVVITKMMPEALVAQELPGVDVVQGPDGRAWSREQVIPHLAHAEALITWGFLKVDDELLSHAPNLKVVANAAAGVNNLDVPALDRHGVWATNVPDAFAVPTAEVAIGLMVSLMRRISEGERYLRAGEWKEIEPGRFDGVSLAGKRLGLVGFGRIAREVARRATAFGMEVLYTRRGGVEGDVSDDGNATYRSLDELLETADVVSLHTPLTEETHQLIDASRFAKMKPTAFLINTARGKVVDQDALIDALASGRLAGAGLDVFADEPRVPARLLALDNVVVTPHLGGASVESRRESYRQALENVRLVLEGREPRSPVNRGKSL